MREVTFGDTYTHKFGANLDIDTGTVPEDVWLGGGAYTWASAAAASTIVSDSANDAAAGTGARTVRVYGLDSSWNHISEDVTMTGTDSVALSNSYLRVYRAKVLTAGTGETNAGAITIAIDGTTAAVIGASYGQTLQALFTSAAGELWEFISLFVAISGKIAATAEIALQMKTNGEAWQTKFMGQVNEAQFLDYRFSVPLMVPPQTDVRVRVLDVAANNTEVSATFGMVRVQP